MYVYKQQQQQTENLFLLSFCKSESSGVPLFVCVGVQRQRANQQKQTNLGEILLSLSLLPYWGVSKLFRARFRTKRNGGNGIDERCRCLHQNQKQLQRQQHFSWSLAISCTAAAATAVAVGNYFIFYFLQIIVVLIGHSFHLHIVGDFFFFLINVDNWLALDSAAILTAPYTFYLNLFHVLVMCTVQATIMYC